MSEGSYWAVLTAPVLESERLSDGAKLFYGQLSRFTGKTGICWASNQTLSQELGVSEKTIQRYVRELRDAGFISTELVGVKDRKRRVERHIRLAMPVPFALPDPDKNVQVKVDKNVQVKVDKNVQVNMDKNVRAKVDKNVQAHKESNNSYNNTPLEPPRENRGPEPAKWKPERFEAFWAYYRRNVNPANRAAARRAWDKLKPDDNTIAEIGLALRERLRSDAEWKRGIGKPHASTYLNGQQWLDTGPAAQETREEAPREEAFGVWH